MHVAVEGLVGVDETLVFPAEVADALQVDAGLQALDQQRIGPLRQHVHDLQFQRAAQEVRLAGGGDVDAADDRGVLGVDLDQGLFGQPHQRIPDGRLAQAVGVGQGHAGQGRAGGQFQRDDLQSQVFENLGRRVAGSVQSELGALHRKRWGGDAGTNDESRSVAGFYLADALMY
ncbi:hypothetical protein D3C72_1811230 [compost metagenome]